MMEKKCHKLLIEQNQWIDFGKMSDIVKKNKTLPLCLKRKVFNHSVLPMDQELGHQNGTETGLFRKARKGIY